MLSDICMHLLKHILPPNELKYMLVHWFGKSREEVREQMLKHGFVVTNRKPAVEENVGEIPEWVVMELAGRLKEKGLDSSAVSRALANAGIQSAEMKQIEAEAESHPYTIFSKTLNRFN